MNAVTVTDEAHDPRSRFGLYKLCACESCDGRGQVATSVRRTQPRRDVELYGPGGSRGGMTRTTTSRCSDCGGEGRIRQEVASCESPEAVGVALVTLAREGEWNDCPFGLLDREGTRKARWLVLPWQASPRNVRDAARTLARSKTKPQSS